VENSFIIKTKITEQQMQTMENKKEKQGSFTNNRSAIEQTGAEIITEKIRESLLASFGKEKIILPFRKVDTVGPKIGEELRSLAYWLTFLSLLAILIYISIRFQFKFAVASIIALIHDVSITLGVFSYFEKEINIPIIAAVLFIIGYSLNDTIVVFDRIRENLKIMHGKSYWDIINVSISKTLNRTIITSLTTLLAALALFIWGPAVIHDFSFLFIIGIVSGTYSSIFVASPILFDWWRIEESRKKA